MFPNVKTDSFKESELKSCLSHPRKMLDLNIE